MSLPIFLLLEPCRVDHCTACEEGDNYRCASTDACEGNRILAFDGECIGKSYELHFYELTFLKDYDTCVFNTVYMSSE